MSLRRRPFDASAAPSLYSFFESLAPLERVLVSVARRLLRNRGAEPGVLHPDLRSDDAAAFSLHAVIGATPSGLHAPGLKSASSEFAPGLPDAVATALHLKRLWVEEKGPEVLCPRGVCPGMIFAALSRASRGERSRWLDSANWERLWPAPCTSRRKVPRSGRTVESGPNRESGGARQIVLGHPRSASRINLARRQ